MWHSRDLVNWRPDNFVANDLGLQWRGASDVARVGGGELAGAAEAGLALFGPDGANGVTAVALRPETATSYVRGRGERGARPFSAPRAFLRIRNVDQDVALYLDADGRTWTKFPWGSEVSGNGVVRVALYATGGGAARFRRFT